MSQALFIAGTAEGVGKSTAAPTAFQRATLDAYVKFAGLIRMCYP